MAEATVDLAQRLIDTLDAMDGCPDDEDGAAAEPSLAAPEGHTSQVGWCRGGDEDREAEEVALQEANVPTENIRSESDARPAAAAIVIPLSLVPRGGRGSLCTAAAIVLLDMVAGQG